MGEVYQALDGRRGHSVALKTVPLTRWDSREAMQRLVSEAHLAQRIVHPNVCRTYEGLADGSLSDGASARYVVMEYVEGSVLADRLRAHGALGISEAWRLGREVLSGLEAIHRAGILHLDLKADNIIVRAREGCPRVTITDFGLARAISPEGMLTTDPCRTEGTLSHMAPEQFLGGPLTPATDIFAFGVTLFELLTGRLPFPSPNVRAHGLQSRSTTNTRLLLRQLTSDLPSLMVDFVARCLESSPAQRYADATAALKVFDELLSPRDILRS
jgi:serine/threonine-protein kinase